MARSTGKSGYLPSLDGWRCFAILGVMLAHDARRVLFGHSTAFYQGAGGFGVQLFFAISGILIAWRIQEEEEKTGRFRLKSFYTRRLFRIQPPQWVFLAAVGLLMGLHLIAGRWKYWFGALLLYENYLWHEVNRARTVHDSYLVGHFWTLAVEEHFYLLISSFFFFCKKNRAPILGGFLLLLLVGQTVGVGKGYFSTDVSARRTPWVIQYLIFPALIAIVIRQPNVMGWVKRSFQPWKAFLLTVLLMSLHHLIYYRAQPLRPSTMIYADSPMLFYSFTGWVVASMLHPASLTTRFLELRPFRFIGRLSYSLYLWHLFLFGGGTPALCSLHWLTLSNKYTVGRYAFSFILACASYYLIEKPFIRLGHRLAPPATPGHRDLSSEAPSAELLSQPAVAALRS